MSNCSCLVPVVSHTVKKGMEHIRLFWHNLNMKDNMSHHKSLLIPAFVLALIIQACSSMNVGVSTLTDPSSSGAVQPTLTMVNSPPSTMPPGTSPSNPAQVGSDDLADNMKFVITGTVRPADGIVSSGDMYNNQPGELHHYIFITLEVTCETTTDQRCHFSPFRLKLMGLDGSIEYPERLISGVEGILEDKDIQAGEIISGNVPFIIPIGAAHLQLVYESMSGDSVYLALP